MESLRIMQVFVGGLLEHGSGNLRELAENFLCLTSWSLSPRAAVMLEYCEMVKAFVEVPPGFSEQDTSVP